MVNTLFQNSPALFVIFDGVVSILLGLFLIFGMIANKLGPRIVFLFFITTALSTLSIIWLPNPKMAPGIAIEIASINIVSFLKLLAILVATVAFYFFKLYGAWRKTFIITTISAFYVNLFILIIKLFEYVPFLLKLDPMHDGPPFGLSQMFCMELYFIVTLASINKFKSRPANN